MTSDSVANILELMNTPNIAARVRLRPAQLRTVADRRFDDAETLRRTGQNARANGAIYLGGIVVECLLKARLLEQHPWLASQASPQGLSRKEQSLWSLCYRSHNLDEILKSIPDLAKGLVNQSSKGHSQRGSRNLLRSFKSVCSNWSIFIRYSPRMANIKEAQRFLDTVKELKEVL